MSALFLDATPQNTPRTDSHGVFAVSTDLREWLVHAPNLKEDLIACAETIDSWIPFVCWSQLLSRLANSHEDLLADEVLLAASALLVAKSPPANDARTKEYQLVKTSFLNAEIEGFVSVRLAQAQLLLQLYEFMQYIRVHQFL